VNTSAPSLNAAQLRRAVVLLDREQLTASERWRFEWLNRSVWSVLALAVAWPVILFANDRLQLIPLILLLGAGASVLAFFFLNIPLLWKFVRVARTETRLGIRTYVSVLTAAIASKKGWRSPWTRTISAAVLIIGGLGVGVGGLALTVESEPEYIAADIAAVIFGLGCLSLIPLNRVTRRLDAISSLREAVGEHRGQSNLVLDSAQRTFIATLERTQIVLERDEAAAARRSRQQAGGVRFAQPFQASVARLSADELSRVYQAVRQLVEQVHVRHRQQPDARIENERFAVEGTSLALGFSRDAHTGEVVAHQLYRSGQAIAPSDVQERTR
jgi:hypothetical protein